MIDEPTSPALLSRGRRAELMVSTSWAMTAATIQLFIIAVLAAELIDEFGLSRGQIGVLGAVNTGVGAVTAPHLGRLADRLGASRAMVALVVVSASGILLTSVATHYWMLALASGLTGLPQGACNPVTNKVIADEVPPPQQGTVTGVKQSGVQVAVFLAGAIMPSSAAAFGWRLAVAGFGIFTLLTAAILALRFAHTPAGTRTSAPAPAVTATPTPAGVASATGSASPGASPAPTRGRRVPLDPFVRQVAIYAFLLGVCAGGVTRFYPLFAHEVLGYSEATAGLAVSLAGLAAIVARLAWAKLVESTMSNRAALVVMGVGSAATVSLLLGAEGQLRWLLWPAVVGMAFTVAAWNVVAMLAVIQSVPASLSGRATGVVLMGFLGGLTLSAPVVGWSVDQFGSYRPAWITLAVFGLLGALAVAQGRTSRRSRRTLPSEVLGRASTSSS